MTASHVSANAAASLAKVAARKGKPAEVTSADNVVKISKGKAAATPAAAIKLEADRVYRVAPSTIKVEEGYNVRSFNPDNTPADAELLKSIQHGGGIKTPLTVRQDDDGSIYVVAGHRRLGAAMALISAGKGGPVSTIPVMLATLKDNSKREFRDIDLMQSNSGEKLTPMQRAMAMSRMVEAGYSHVAIANVAGVTDKYVRMLLGMLTLPAALQEHMLAGRIKENLVIELVGELDPTDKANAPNTIAAVTKALDIQQRKVGFGGELKVTRKMVEAALPPKAPVAPAPAAKLDGEGESAGKPDDKPQGDKIAEGLAKAVASAATVDVSAHERAPRTPTVPADAAPIADKPAPKLAAAPGVAAKGSKFTANGTRILLDGKTFCTFAGNDEAVARSRAVTALTAFQNIEHLFQV